MNEWMNEWVFEWVSEWVIEVVGFCGTGGKRDKCGDHYADAVTYIFTSDTRMQDCKEIGVCMIILLWPCDYFSILWFARWSPLKQGDQRKRNHGFQAISTLTTSVDYTSLWADAGTNCSYTNYLTGKSSPNCTGCLIYLEIWKSEVYSKVPHTDVYFFVLLSNTDNKIALVQWKTVKRTWKDFSSFTQIDFQESEFPFLSSQNSCESMGFGFASELACCFTLISVVFCGYDPDAGFSHRGGF